MTASWRFIRSQILRLRSPTSGTVGQGIRFALAGCVVGLVYLTTTTVLADVFAVRFQFALMIGFAIAFGAHFTLQRRFVWVHDAEFALGFSGQMSRYLLVASAQYVITATSTLVLPEALDMSVTLVYFATAMALATVNFVIFRNKVFYAR